MEVDVGSKRRGEVLDERSVPAAKGGRVEGQIAAGGVRIVSSGADFFSERMLASYYAKMFPFQLMTRWLSYGNDPLALTDNPLNQRDFFSRREICFTMADDVFIRYLCFNNASEFAIAVRDKRPHKIDIGPVCSVRPDKNKTVQHFRHLQRELVFDIDMDAYDSIRTCCVGATVCTKCWVYIAAAVKVLKEGLTQDFGFSHVLFVYSGRRGMHCWVCDESARMLDNAGRAAVAEYLSVLTTAPEPSAGGAGAGVAAGAGEPTKGAGIARTARSIWRNAHPSIVRSYRTLEPIFLSSIIPAAGQQLLTAATYWTPVLDAIPPVPVTDHDIPALRDTRATLRSVIAHRWAAASTPLERWNDLRAAVTQLTSQYRGVVAGSRAQAAALRAAERIAAEELPWHARVGAGVGSEAPFRRMTCTADDYRAHDAVLEGLIPAIVFTYTYPRLDIDVSKTINHLLKAPFCIHPKTGRVCVPLDADTVQDFDPAAAPQLRTLVTEVAALEASGVIPPATKEDVSEGVDRAQLIVSNTSLSKYMSFFANFVQRLERTATDKFRRERERAAGWTADF